MDETAAVDFVASQSVRLSPVKRKKATGHAPNAPVKRTVPIK